jgi:PTH2 family peptidyl-tRNA hydrolase
VKQVIVVNESLGLPRGKLAAQVAHAAVDALLEAPARSQQRWLRDGQPKIVLRGETETQLRELLAAAQAAKLPAALIEDAGHTVVAAGTVTCLGIGPADSKAIDQLTGALKLLK